MLSPICEFLSQNQILSLWKRKKNSEPLFQVSFANEATQGHENENIFKIIYRLSMYNILFICIHPECSH